MDTFKYQGVQFSVDEEGLRAVPVGGSLYVFGIGGIGRGSRESREPDECRSDGGCLVDVRASWR